MFLDSSNCLNRRVAVFSNTCLSGVKKSSQLYDFYEDKMAKAHKKLQLQKSYFK